MSCCPASPPAAVIGAALADGAGPESDILPGENVDCYMARGGNIDGQHDDATEEPKNKIANTSIPVTRDKTKATVNLKLEMTTDSDLPVQWSIETASNVLDLSGDTLSGTWPAGNAELGKTFTVMVRAKRNGAEVDSRSFTFVPTVGGESDEIRLVSPLPGGIINSKYGPRMHPIKKIMKPHTGIDMVLAGGKTTDVVAAADGEVILAGGNATVKSGYGLQVRIKHMSASGKHLCTTTYNHLAKIYVSVGQKVMAGQKIGYEGTTGGSTGNHLHFEVRLPNGGFCDPAPLINGSTKVLAKPGDSPSSPNTKVVDSNASMSEKESEARQKSCAMYGTEEYPQDPNSTNDPVPGTPGDPFEAAWFFTMKHEVTGWSAASPTDPEVQQGLCETPVQKRKTGYVTLKGDTGGETKFGVAKNSNPSTNIKTLPYDGAKKIGYNNYWKNGKVNCNNMGKLVAVMAFDMNYNHGAGNTKFMLTKSGINSLPSDPLEKQLRDCEALYATRVSFVLAINKPQFHRDWVNRAKECFNYVKSLQV